MLKPFVQAVVFDRRHSKPAFTQRAFTLVELLLVIGIVALLVTMLLPALANARKTARMGICLSNMKNHGVAMHTYAADFKDRIFSFSWQRNNTESTYADLRNAPNDATAAGWQMTDIVRRLADRTAAETPRFDANSFFPYMRYSHLVLLDYMGSKLPDPVVVCPEDLDQLRWGRDPRGYDAGKYQPNYGTGGINWRWPYRSSYWITASAVDKNPASFRARPATYSTLTVNTGATTRYGNRVMNDVAYPGAKVYMYEQFGRHTSQKFDYRTYFGFDSAKVVVQFFDNSVSMRNAKDANKGNADPRNPTFAGSTVPYAPAAGSPDPRPPGNTMPAHVRFQYTRGGLKGADFNAKEVVPTINEY